MPSAMHRLKSEESIIIIMKMIGIKLKNKKRIKACALIRLILRFTLPEANI
jgi:hypothetical protein